MKANWKQEVGSGQPLAKIQTGMGKSVSKTCVTSVNKVGDLTFMVKLILVFCIRLLIFFPHKQKSAGWQVALYSERV